MRVVFGSVTSSQTLGWIRKALSSRAWYSMRSKNASKTRAGTGLPRPFLRVPLCQKRRQKRENRPDGPYRAVSCLGLQHLEAFREQDARRRGGEALRL